MMDTLAQVHAALRAAHGTLPDRDAITDLAYLHFIDTYGTEGLLVYLTVSDEQAFDPASKLAIENALEEALSSAFDYCVYCHWQTAEESVQGRRETEDIFFGQPRSALH